MLPDRMKALFVAAAISVCVLTNAFALETTLTGQNEERARTLFKELRCVVCQNQSIDDSDADVARDLRAIVREQISTGKSDSEIRSFLVSRYGEFVLLKPAFAMHTLLLWLMPILLLAVGGIIILRGRRRSKTAPLSSAEQDELSRIVGSTSEKP